jgi:hypothetical protein
MKTFFFTTILFFSVFILQAQIVNIPDANFKNALVNTNCADLDGDGTLDGDVDTNNDGEIQESEAQAVLSLFVMGKYISSLEGIQSFTNILKLFCDENQLSSLDISQNPNLEVLDCNDNKLTNLDVSQNSNLRSLYCRNNQLTNLDVSQNSNLRTLSCAINQLTNLNVTQNSNLETLECSNNLITNLYLTQNQNLSVIYCPSNQLASLNLTQNSNLEILKCNNNLLASLNIKNGNNHDIWIFDSRNNTNLSCITVDDVTYAYNQVCSTSGWCKDEWTGYNEAIGEDCILGIQVFNQIVCTIYPNPSQDIIHIESREPIISVRIYSINGNLIKETSNNSIRVSELSKGLYFAQINVRGNSITKKFIKD